MNKIHLKVKNMLTLCQQVAGIIDAQQTMPILAHVMIEAQGQTLKATTSDSQMQLQASVELDEAVPEITFTVSGKKLFDICKSLNPEAPLTITTAESQISFKSGKSLFRLSTLPAEDFPSFQSFSPSLTFQIAESDFHTLLRKTTFAMASTDVRYYLNGLLLETNEHELVAVATDGHRLAVCRAPREEKFSHKIQSLIPRKTAIEINKLLNKNSKDMIEINLGTSTVSITKPGLSMVSKLIDGRFPDYEQAIPQYRQKPTQFNKDALKGALQRTAILSNEKVGGIYLNIIDQALKIFSKNPSLGDAEEVVPIEEGSTPAIRLGINAHYFLDVLNLIESQLVNVFFKDNDSSILIESPSNDAQKSLYLIMPICL